MEQLSLVDVWDDQAEQDACTLCDHADDAGSAMAYLKQMDTALGGRTTDARLAQMMLESYDTFFLKPALQAGQDAPRLTEAELTRHFTEHDINPLRQLRKDINRLNAIQESMAPRQQTGPSEADAKNWVNLQRLKMDLVKQYDMCDRHTSRDMPSLGSS